MGWSEARVTLVPDGWDMVVDVIDLHQQAGQTVRVISTERSLDYTGDLMRLSPLEGWLLSCGFCKIKESKVEWSFRRNDLLVDVYIDHEEVREITLEFGLTRDSPRHWSGWQRFVDELCRAWPVTLADIKVGIKVGPHALFELLRREISWQDFERSFGWCRGPGIDDNRNDEGTSWPTEREK